MKHLILFCLLLSATSVIPQKKTISGIVTNEKGTPLQLANVILLGTDLGTVTDSEGSFELSGKFESVGKLRVSYIGYEPVEMEVIDFYNQSNIIIVLKRKVLTSQTVLVKGVIGEVGISPLTFSKVSRDDIEKGYVNQDIPELLSYLPSTTFYSEGGGNIGYNYLSIRGFDQRRISVSINGIPQNDPEDHNVYWVDFPDLIASTEMIQVQRGAGSGVIGYPAVGGSINIITSPFSDKSRFELDVKTGSYNTRKYTVSFASGLINNKYSIYAKLGHLLSDGYKENNWVDFKSYHFSAVRYDENFTTQINLFGGPIADGLTYTGIAKFAVKDKELRRKNYSYWEADESGYTYTLERRKDEIENFSQPHYELLNEIKLSDDILLNSALFLVSGQGFFDYDGSWSIYYDDYFRLESNGFDPGKVPENALIRAKVENTQWGWIPRMSINHNRGTLILGAEIRKHKSLHWGSINYAENLPAGVTKDYRYYQYNGAKDIFNFYAHEKYRITDNINLLAELQVAYHEYAVENEKYLNNEFSISNTFLNPRFGINYVITAGINGFFSFARVSREPRLKTYYDAAESSAGELPMFELNSDGSYDFDKPLVEPETMNSFELGFNYTGGASSLSLNSYLMLFDNEIVKQGQVDRFGQPITGNVERTVHTGIELSAVSRINSHSDLRINGSFSQNYISKGRYYISENEYINLDGNRISGFPELTFNAIVNYRFNGLFLQLTAKYVGEFYSDNYDKKLTDYLNAFPGFVDYSDNIVESYFVSNLLASYELELDPYFSKLKIFLQVNNIFDKLYAAYAVGKEFYPAAERNFITGIMLGL
ncbi:MAG: TonB-dependent receptor [Melioribacteraceae bacterium]|nr:TonB-dependent receptor [Melioribacteraceae bacterium]